MRSFFVSGYALGFDNVDDVNDVIRKGAVKATDFLKVPLLYMHEATRLPIGRIISAREQHDGIMITAEIFGQAPEASMILEILKNGGNLGLSIGYRVTASECQQSPYTRFIKNLELIEVSIVTLPANKKCIASLAAPKRRRK